MKQNYWQSASLYHLGKRSKLKTIQKYLDKQNVFEDCLDIGTGTGAVAREIKKYAKRWTYLDNDEQALVEAKKILTEGSFVSDIKQLGERRYDLITIIDTFYYFPNPDSYIEKLAKMLKPNGKLLITLTDGDKRRIINKIRQKIGLGMRMRGFKFEESPAKFINRLEKTNYSIEYSKKFSYFVSELLLMIYDLAQVKVNHKNQINKDQFVNREEVSLMQQIFLIVSFPVFFLISQLDLIWRLFSSGYKFIVVCSKK